MPGTRTLVFFLASLLLASCVSTDREPEFQAARVFLKEAENRIWLVRGELERPLGALDAPRAVRLVRVLFPDAVVVEGRGAAVIDVDSPESATALVDGLRWVDGMILARRGLREEMDTPASSDAGLVAETIRRWLMVDPPAPHPDWSAMSRALDNPGLWTESPRSAGLGAVVLAGILTRGGTGPEARNRAGELLTRTLMAEQMPGWISWVAYHSWSSQNFLAD